MNFNQEKKLAVVMVKEVGAFLKKNFNKYDRSKGFKIKSKSQIQLWVDRAAEQMILARIKKQFPGHKILAEESGLNKKHSDYYWIIDPLDGTTNYSMHLPAYGVSIALAYQGEIVLGATNIPELNELMIAEKGQGVFLNGKRVHVSKQKDAKKALLTFCHGSMINDMKRAINMYTKFKLHGLDYRQIGSSVVEFNFVATGRTEAIMLPGANLYDVAAGALFVKEAGGRVTDFNDKNWTIRSKDILASNGLVHSQVLKIINKK